MISGAEKKLIVVSFPTTPRYRLGNENVMDLDMEIIRTSQKVNDLMESGYTRQEAVLLIQAAAMSKLSDCVRSAYNGKIYFNMTGNIATYEQ